MWHKIKGFLLKIWHMDPKLWHMNPLFCHNEPFLVGVVFNVLSSCHVVFLRLGAKVPERLLAVASGALVRKHQNGGKRP